MIISLLSEGARSICRRRLRLHVTAQQLEYQTVRRHS